MPKMKSRSAAKKRYQITGNGKIKRKKAYTSHILNKKSTKRKRNLRKKAMMHPTSVKQVKKMLAGRTK